MLEQGKKQIVIVGCGNVAWHLAKQLYKKFDLIIYNHKANAQLAEFKKEFNAQTYSSIKNIYIYIWNNSHGLTVFTINGTINAP